MDLFTKVHEVYVKNFSSVIHASKLKRGAHVSLVTFIYNRKWLFYFHVYKLTTIFYEGVMDCFSCCFVVFLI